MGYQTPDYLKALLVPTPKRQAGKRIWSLDLESVWLPFFTATNAMAETNVAHDAIGAPVRLALAGDGSIKFGKSGMPMTRVAKELGEAVRMARENFAAGLQNHAAEVLANYPDQYREQLRLAHEAGAPIIAKDKARLEEEIAKQMEAVAKPEPEPEPEKVEIPV